MPLPHDVVFFLAGSLTVPEAAKNNSLLYILIETIQSGIHEDTGATVRTIVGKRPADIAPGECPAWYFSQNNACVAGIADTALAEISGGTWQKLTPTGSNPIAIADVDGNIRLETVSEAPSKFGVDVPAGKRVYITAGTPEERAAIATALCTLAGNALGATCTQFVPMDPWTGEFAKVLKCILAVAVNEELYSEKIVVVSKGTTTAGLCVCDGVSNLLELIKLSVSTYHGHIDIGNRSALILHKHADEEEAAFQTRIGLNLSNMIHENRRSV
jgi:hypothetical protein